MILIATASKRSVSTDTIHMLLGIIDQSLSVAIELGPFVDCTSNQVSHTGAVTYYNKTALIFLQADAYLELITPARAELLKKSVVLARELKLEFQDVSYEALAVEIAVCLTS